MLKLYQTVKLDGYLDQHFYLEATDSSNVEVDPIYNWFADLLFINGKKTIILSNELTRFTFLIPDYSNYKTGFQEIFCRYFSYAMYFHDLTPDPYLDSFSEFGLNRKADKSTLGHLSRLKEGYLEIMKKKYSENDFEEFLRYYDIILNQRPCTIKNIKGYIEPNSFWEKELKTRKLL
jgi:hypothetical protein